MKSLKRLKSPIQLRSPQSFAKIKTPEDAMEFAINLIHEGNLTKLNRLCSQTYDFDLGSNDKYGRSLLMYAALEGKPDIVMYLLRESRINIEATDKKGKNVLHWLAAATSPNHVVTEILLGRMTPEAIDQADQYGETPLLTSCANVASMARVRFIQRLIACGANIEARNCESFDMMEILAYRNKDVQWAAKAKMQISKSVSARAKKRANLIPSEDDDPVMLHKNEERSNRSHPSHAFARARELERGGKDRANAAPWGSTGNSRPELPSATASLREEEVLKKQDKVLPGWGPWFACCLEKSSKKSHNSTSTMQMEERARCLEKPSKKSHNSTSTLLMEELDDILPGGGGEELREHGELLWNI